MVERGKRGREAQPAVVFNSSSYFPLHRVHEVPVTAHSHYVKMFPHIFYSSPQDGRIYSALAKFMAVFNIL